MSDHISDERIEYLIALQEYTNRVLDEMLGLLRDLVIASQARRQ